MGDRSSESRVSIASRSLGNSITDYDWTLVSWPDGSDGALAFNDGESQSPDYEDAPFCPPDQNTMPEPCFIPDVPGVYTFELVARDYRPYCPLGEPGIDACETGADCCSFSCNGASATCDGDETQGVCHGGGGCEIESVNVSTVHVRTINAGIIIMLEWDGTGDLDLHLVDDFSGRCATGGVVHLEQSCKDDTNCAPGDICETNMRRQWRGAGDCYWASSQPDWGEPQTTNGEPCATNFDCIEFLMYPDCVGPPGDAFCTNTLDDPLLLKDENTAYGPEIIKLRDPFHDPGPPNVYHIGAHYFPDSTHYESRTVTVYLYYGGLEVFALGQPGVRMSTVMQNTAAGDNMFWYAGWLVVTPTDATLIPTGFPLVNIKDDGYPALEDPP